MHLCLVLFVLTPVHICGLDVIFQTFRYVYGILNKREGFGPRVSLAALSPSYCTAMCNAYRNGCSIALYNRSSELCQLFYWKEVAKIQLHPNPNAFLDSTLYIKTGYKLLHTGLIGKYYPFTMLQAEEACNRFGGQLATKEEFIAAKYAGWELCNCGWVNNGNAYFWVSQATGGCGRTVMHRCARTIQKFDAHCTLAGKNLQLLN